MKQLCKHLYLKTFGPNQNISVNRTTYIILSGRVLVTQELDSTKPKTFTDISDIQQYSQVSEMTFGQSFNEFGLQDVQKSTAVTLRQTDVACLDFKFIIELNSNIKSSENNEKIAFLKQLTYIQQFSDNEIKYFAYKLEVIKPQKNETIYQEGDQECDWAYFVFKGEFSLTKRDENQTEHQLTRLAEGEVFGEESFLNYDKRYFNIKCLCDSAMLFRISNVEFEKKVWQRESRNILFLLIGEKWIFRLKRFVELSKQPINTEELKAHLAYLEEISTCKLNFQLQETEFNPKNISNQLKSNKGIKQQKSKILPNSLIIQNTQQFNQFFQHQTCKAQHSNKNLSFEKTHTNAQTKLADNYPKNSEQQPKRRVLQKIINPNVKSTKISSHFNFELTTNEQPEVQLDNFVKTQNVVNDEVINWGGNSSRRNQELKEQFYNAIKSYASHVKYQNLNFMEASSNYSKQLNSEYELLMKKQQENIGNFFELEPRSKTDNQLRKEYFLKQLKKMQKRLQVLQMIAKGYITCKYNQYVNEEGEIVDIIEKVSKDDAYEIKDGKKQLKFNFVTSINYKPVEKPKFKDFDQQIVEQEEQIRVISDIVSGKLDPEQVPYVNEEYTKQMSMRKKASEVFQTPTLVKSFSSKLRISSATYKKDLSKNIFSNAIKIRKMT
ncbi:unnamed protein product (macronuclear) [Paramecium tetraurelia]|uniref:Cyclic nucleotide-binding domain-containing protein n=1 Tax=Paramecium tetraurelia TaxID=5888 RepID=A0CY49_PARTE|nr:uncharacterized protein GSPATT00011348001 [Paramecium tetraurelia]CAK75716.1 unnamed protein product [Paramecium tetraurelia]|eukprot:XP_001443113.1 hypothetical protein (macronuclear) [Paramecium tetraurelia strain d4-2]